ncbi:MAG: cupin domain-containing protein [Burkholderiales bacterium]|nr:cupin domain-containing protein [Opitutaceae bacterium]
MSDPSLRPDPPPSSEEPFPLRAALSEEAALLAHSAPPFPLPASVKQELTARVRAASTPPFGWRFDSASSPDGWIAPPTPGVRYKLLSEDAERDVVLVLVELSPGASHPLPAGRYGPEHAMLVRGEMTIGDRTHHAGDSFYAAQNASHQPVSSRSGGVALLTLTLVGWEALRAAPGGSGPRF